MKDLANRYVLRAAIAAVLCVLVAPSAASAAWRQPVGGINADPNRSAGDPSLTLIGGVLHLAWGESDPGGSQVRVARLGSGGTGWEEIGGGSGSISLDGGGPSLTGVAGRPHVAWARNQSIRVARLTSAGGWESVGGPGPIEALPGRPAHQPRLVEAAGGPYLAFWHDAGVHDARIYVMRPNAAESGWEVVGGAPLGAAEFLRGPSLTSWHGRPVVAWTDGRGVQVRMMSPDGHGWDPVGDVIMPDRTDFRVHAVGTTAVDGALYLAWMDDHIRVARLSSNGLRWDRLPGWADTATQFSTAEPGLTAIGGIPYVAFSQWDGDNYQLRVARQNAPGTGWEEPVGGPSPINENPVRHAVSADLVAVSGIPYVGWAESLRENPTIGYTARIARLEPDLTDTTAVPNSAGATLSARVRSYGLEYSIAFQYGDGFPFQTSAGSTTGDPATVVKEASGLAPSTTYPYRVVNTFPGEAPRALGEPASFTTTVRSADPARLVVLMAEDRLRSKRGRSVRVRYVSTAPAAVTLEIRRGKRVVARNTGTARAGRNVIVWNGRIGRRPAKLGRYILVLKATAGDGQTAADRARLTVVRRLGIRR
jgi:hypothetical protein